MNFFTTPNSKNVIATLCIVTIERSELTFLLIFPWFKELQYVDLQLDLQIIIYNLKSGRIFFQIIVTFKNCHDFVLICAWFFGSLLFMLCSSRKAAMSRALSWLHIVIFSKPEVLRRWAVHGSSGENKCSWNNGKIKQM